MPSITLSGISCATPDGRPILSHLDLSFPAGRSGLIGRNGVGKSTLLDLIAGLRPPSAGILRVEGRIAHLRQAFAPEPGASFADLFGIRAAMAILRRAESGEATAEDLAAADWTWEERLAASLAEFGLEAAPDRPLSTLSGGQRTRARLAALSFDAPDILLLDEPTNNLDAEGREAVERLLTNWRGLAVVVSHDRALLERVDAIVELTSLGASVWGGNWSFHRAQKALALAAAERDLKTAESRQEEVRRKAQAARESKARRDGAGQRDRAKGGAPKILLDAAKGRAEASGGAGARLAERREAQAAEDLAAARARVEILRPLGFALPPTGLPAGRVVVKAEGLSAGPEEAPLFKDLAFEMVGPERLAIEGPNGSGKTTLLRLLTTQGDAAIKAPWALLDQDVTALRPADSLLENFQRLNPEADKNAAHAALAQFLFRNEAARRRAGELSGGQRLRAGLACVLGGAKPPQVLILDEPTNHLDVETIEVLEAALRAYDGALLLVSHDAAFLEAVGITRRIRLPSPAARG